MDDERKKEVALFRLTVLGPLISARLEHGDRRAYFEAAAERIYQWPDGRNRRLSARTIESWYHTWRHGGFTALLPTTRSDARQTRSIRPAVADLLLRAKREKPRRSIRRLIRLLERAGQVRRGELSRSSVHRLLLAHGISARPACEPERERRSFLPEHAGDLWVGDALHGPRVIAPDGRIRKSYLLSQIDAATRFLVHSYFALSEDAVAHEHGFKQALLKHGRPRTYYVDRGAAYWAISLRLICAELDIHLRHTRRRDCEAKGVIERWHRTWREEVGDELPDEPLPIADLNARHWAWLGAEYHRRPHDTTGRAPLEHWLSELSQLRALPAAKNIDEIFLHRHKRRVRKDGTVRFGGELLEVRADLAGKLVELRFDPAEPESRPRVFVDDHFVSDTVVLDRVRNSTRRRRPIAALSPPPPPSEPSGLDPLGLIEREHYQRTRLPPAPGEGSANPSRQRSQAHDDNDNQEE